MAWEGGGRGRGIFDTLSSGPAWVMMNLCGPQNVCGGIVKRWLTFLRGNYFGGYVSMIDDFFPMSKVHYVGCDVMFVAFSTQGPLRLFL